MKDLRILAVDDHEMIMFGYKFILEDSEFCDFKITVDTATSFETGIRKIEESTISYKYDLILLDIQLSITEEGIPHTGEELGIFARKTVPDSKIVYMSSFSDNYKINNLLITVDPDGYMVKSEINKKTLYDMVHTITNDTPYYTGKALQAIRKKMANPITLDENDKKIMYHLAIGTKTKDLTNHISLSLAGIENRKRHLKVIFGIEKQNDQALINEGKVRGFI